LIKAIHEKKAFSFFMNKALNQLIQGFLYLSMDTG